jgi:glycosyltransferase involved in cell wall biosynthesis
MKVLLANKFFFRNGGSETVLFSERDFLRGANVEVVDFSMRDQRNLPSAHADFFVSGTAYSGERRGALHQIGTALKLVHSPEAVRRIGDLIDATQPDLVHCHNIYHQLTPSIIGAAKRRGVPVVLTLHDYKPICPVYTRLRHGEPCSRCIDQSFINVLRHRCADGSVSRSALLYAEAVVQRFLRNYEKLDAVIAPSRFMRDAVTRSRFASDRVHVIYNGIDTEQQHPTTHNEGYALYLGRLSAEKGVETLLAAHASIADRVPLRIAGSGPLEHELRARYPRVQFLGQVGGDTLAAALRAAGMIVVPSQWYENCPMSVLEAMGYGKAVIASDIGGIPELVVHRETGLLFPPGDRDALNQCLVELSNNPMLQARYGAAGRQRIERSFSLTKHNSALLRLYQDVLDSRRGWQANAEVGYSSTP